METLQLATSDLSLCVDTDTGRWLSLVGGKRERNWLAAGADTGLPFVAGTGELPAGHAVQMKVHQEAAELAGRSLRGGITERLWVEADVLWGELTLPQRRGPRSGWILDLDHLDRQSGEGERNIRDTLMPVMMETAADLSWAWLAWQRAEDDLLLTLVDGPSAGWFIRYSYAGHRMEGFQVLARADDVIAPDWPAGRLPDPDRLRIGLAHAADREEARLKAHRLLGLQSASSTATAVVQGGRIDLTPACELTWISPDGSEACLSAVSHLPTDLPGQHRLLRRAPNGRIHESRVLVLAPWEELRAKALSAHRELYQLPRGAFVRCLNPDHLPEGINFGGDPFGDPDVSGSCRTGEFGGFGAWAQLQALLDGQGDSAMESSVRRYLDWMLNRGHEDSPDYGTCAMQPHSVRGRDYGAYHAFEEMNYAQHEGWFVAQLADAVALGWKEYLPDLKGLCRHMLEEHIDATGILWNQNFDYETPVDYSTVDCPMVHLLRAADVLAEEDPALAERLNTVCRKQAEHLLNRGFDFPTEGEACTEDGSIACQAWGLARAYNRIPDPDPEWLVLAQALMAYHAKLELSAADVRLDGSSLRFWETMYETDEWGPSVNAGHGWTLWSAFARLELFEATGDFEDLWQLWRHTVCVASRQEEDGLFHPCYTPDPIPSLPHDDAWGDPAKRHEGRMSTALAGMRYPQGYSVSGIFLWMLVPRIWLHTYGYDPASGRLINARLEDGEVVPHCPREGARYITPDGRL